MLRFCCCFCDCLGGCKNPFSSSSSSSSDRRNVQHLDPNTLNRCLEAVRAHETNEKNRQMAVEAMCPLISSVSGGGEVYRPCPPPPPPKFSSTTKPNAAAPGPTRTARVDDRSYSPPPSYHSSNSSLEARRSRLT